MTTIRFSFNGTDRQIINALQQRQARLIQALTAKMTFLMVKLQNKIQLKLSGEILKNRSGSLFRSIQTQPATFDGINIIGVVTGAGGDASYGQVPETGGTKWYRIAPVNKKALSFMASAEVLNVLRGELDAKQAVVASVWHPPAIKRPFMSTSLQESITDIETGLKETIIGVMKE